MTDRCGDVDGTNPTGVRGCPDPAAVYIEWTDQGGTDVAAVLCQSHAARLRAGEDIYDDRWVDPSFAVEQVTLWRSA